MGILSMFDWLSDWGEGRLDGDSDLDSQEILSEMMDDVESEDFDY